MMSTKLAVAVAATVATVSLASGAIAQSAPLSVSVSLTDAIATAERQTGAKAYEAGIENEGGVMRIEVKTRGPDGKKTVYVDPGTGAITARPANDDED